MATILLVRHGETEWNRTERIQGWAPVPLNERGREQARAVGEYLANDFAIDGVTCSDLRRTSETASLIGDAGIGIDPVFDRDWRERHLGVLQGLDYTDVFEENAQYDFTNRVANGIDARPELGESIRDLRERVLRGWNAVLDRVTVPNAESWTEGTTDETHLVVTHGGPIYALLGSLENNAFGEAFEREHQENCAVNEIRIENGDATVVTENDVSYRSA